MRRAEGHPAHFSKRIPCYQNTTPDPKLTGAFGYLLAGASSPRLIVDVVVQSTPALAISAEAWSQIRVLVSAVSANAEVAANGMIAASEMAAAAMNLVMVVSLESV
jgi:hypothetical protein